MRSSVEGFGNDGRGNVVLGAFMSERAICMSGDFTLSVMAIPRLQRALEGMASTGSIHTKSAFETSFFTFKPVFRTSLSMAVLHPCPDCRIRQVGFALMCVRPRPLAWWDAHDVLAPCPL